VHNTIPFEKKVFEVVIFLLKYHQNPPSPQETEHKKRRGRKIIGKKERKRGRKRKAPRVSSDKGEVNILREEKYFNFKNIFFNVIPFSPPPSYYFKNPF
jgi:hypothetical protein